MEDLPTQEIEKQDPEKALKELNEVLKKDEEIKIEVPKYVPEEKSEEKKLVGRESADGENGGQSGRARNWDNTDSDVRHQRMPRCRTSRCFCVNFFD